MMIGINIRIYDALRSFLLGCAAVSVAVLIRMWSSDVLGDSFLFVTFFPAVLVAAMLGGWIAGLITSLTTLIAGLLYFEAASLQPPHLAAAFFYLAGCALSILAAERMRNASERSRQAEHKLATALDVSGVGTWRWDVARDNIEWDERLCRIFGVALAEAPKTAADFLKLVADEDRAQVLALIEASLRTPHAAEYEYRIHNPHTGLRWIADRNNVLCGPDGKPVEIVGASMDVTERKQADEHRDLLIRELHHRVRNTLAMVQGMANATANSAQDLVHFKETFARRIASLAMTHALLTDEKTQSTMLSRLVRQELEALGMAERLDFVGVDLLLPSELAVPLGMAMHELATNALKYGALSKSAGRIRVECAWKDEICEIVWNEMNGPTVSPPQRRGFGAQLLDRVIEMQLGVKTSQIFAPAGLRFTISVPRERLAATANDQRATIHAQAS